MEDKNGLNQLYVLRLWRGPATGMVRITLKDVARGGTRHFVSLEALLAYLENENGVSVSKVFKTHK